MQLQLFVLLKLYLLSFRKRERKKLTYSMSENCLGPLERQSISNTNAYLHVYLYHDACR